MPAIQARPLPGAERQRRYRARRAAEYRQAVAEGRTLVHLYCRQLVGDATYADWLVANGAPLPGASGRPVRITPHPGRCTRPGADGRAVTARLLKDAETRRPGGSGARRCGDALYGAIRGNAGSVAGMEDSLFGKPARNFAPRTIWTGDNLDILRGINSETVDLIYLDPPFNSNRTYSAPIGSKAAGAAFEDTWTLDKEDVAWMGLIADQHPAIHSVVTAAGDAHSTGMQSYLRMMAVRLLELRRVLTPTGSIYLHCDPVASHYLKLLMDAIYGKDNYRNEVVWHYKSFHGNVKRYFPRKHDVLFVYNKSAEWTFNRLFEEDNTDTIDRQRWFDYLVDGRYILGRNMPTQDSRFVRFLNRWIRENGRDPGPNDVVYEVVGQALDTVWDIKPVDPKDKRERIGYPTQKPLALLERVIRASSNVGDVVLDPFCGCATACVAADNLQREWVGIDISPMAVELVHRRLRDTLGGLYHAGMVTARTDIPQRTDIEAPINYRQNRHVLFGEQEGKCHGCQMEFPFKMFEVDHQVPRSRGGTDHKSNLQLLCSPCNRIKGDRPMEYLMARLAEYARPA